MPSEKFSPHLPVLEKKSGMSVASAEELPSDFFFFAPGIQVLNNKVHYVVLYKGSDQYIALHFSSASVCTSIIKLLQEKVSRL